MVLADTENVESDEELDLEWENAPSVFANDHDSRKDESYSRQQSKRLIYDYSQASFDDKSSVIDEIVDHLKSKQYRSYLF